MATHMDQFTQLVAHTLRGGLLQCFCDFANDHKDHDITPDELIQHMCVPGVQNTGVRIASLPRAPAEIPPTSAPSTKGRRKKTPALPPPEIPKPPPGHCEWFFRTGGADKKNTYCGKATDGGCPFCKDCCKKDNAKRELEARGLTVPVPAAKNTVQTLAVQPDGPPILRVVKYDESRGLYLETNTRLVVYENEKSELFYIGKDVDGNIVDVDDHDRQLAAQLEIQEAPTVTDPESPVPIPVPTPVPAPVPVPTPVGAGAAPGPAVRTLGRGPAIPALVRPNMPNLPPMPRLQ